LDYWKHWYLKFRGHIEETVYDNGISDWRLRDGHGSVEYETIIIVITLINNNIQYYTQILQVTTIQACIPS